MSKLKDVIEVILSVLAAMILLPCLVIGALVLYDAPVEIRNKAVLILICVSIAVVGGLLIAEEIKGGK